MDEKVSIYTPYLDKLEVEVRNLIGGKPFSNAAVQLFEEYIEEIELPETPQSRMTRLISDFGISEKYAKTLVKDKDVGDLFEEVVG